MRFALALAALAAIAPAQNPEAMVAPAIRSRVQAKYTSEALEAGLIGKVLLSVKVDANGVPTEVKFLRWTGGNGDDPLGLDSAAIEAVRQWRFYPQIRWGTRAPFQANITVDFDFRRHPEQAPKNRA
ncbi:MAG TPA: energy transducer TonB [Bryobacteraceae bacterium]|nr:energy transducer TonB [Bryobacteraceae bacterium]